MAKGSILHSVWRAFIAFLSFGVPAVFTTFPTWESMTIGAVAYAVLHYGQSKVGL